MNSIKLSPRLLTAASMVPPDSHVIDVGTDHAYLPIYLLLSGKVRSASASDINEGPIAAARIQEALAALADPAVFAEKYGVAERLELYLSDGLKECNVSAKYFNCIIICGMGGELISSIIENTPEIKHPGTSFVLQPMTRAEQLRLYLSENGFSIKDEKLVRDSGKIYQCFSAEYTGKTYSLSLAQLLCGPIIMQKYHSDPLRKEFIHSTIANLQKIADGKSCSGAPNDKEKMLIGELSALI